MADRVGAPQPVLVTVWGLVLGLISGVPASHIAPGLILPLVLPPLPFAAAQSASIRQLRAAARPILELAIGLPVVTAAGVTVLPSRPTG